MKSLRTPDERFKDLPGYPFAPHYLDVPDGEGDRLRIHYVDEAQERPSRSCLSTESLPGRTFIER